MILDPVSHTPESSFPTDASGELTIEVAPMPGASQVAVAIGGDTFVVDLAEASSRSNVLEVAIDHYDFTDISSGYQSTATLTPDFGGAPTAPFGWSLVRVVNTTGTFWRRGPNDQHGLTWGQTAAGGTDWGAVPVSGSPPNTRTAFLTDIVGNRVVEVRASAYVGGVQVTKNLIVNFGPGPLSVFSGTYHTGRQWATSSSYADWRTTMVPANFPAAAFCSGGSWAPGTTIDVDGGGVAYYDGLAGWEEKTIDLKKFGHSAPSKLPTMDQLLSVSRYDGSYNAGIPRKGAILAAGYPSSFMSELWSGDITYSSGNFWGIRVDISSGRVPTYGANLTANAYGLCLR